MNTTRGCRHAPVLEGETGGMVGTAAALGDDDVVPSEHWAAREEEAVLEHRIGIAEHEVHRPGDLEVPVELGWFSSKSVSLESLELAATEHGAFRVRQEGHRLYRRLACSVLYGQSRRGLARLSISSTVSGNGSRRR